MAENRWSKQVLEWMQPGRRKAESWMYERNGRERSKGRTVGGWRRMGTGNREMSVMLRNRYTAR
jgi:hypothetical protein